MAADERRGETRAADDGHLRLATTTSNVAGGSVFFHVNSDRMRME